MPFSSLGNLFPTTLRRLEQPFHRKQKIPPVPKMPQVADSRLAVPTTFFLGHCFIILETASESYGEWRTHSLCFNPGRKNQNNFRQGEVFCHYLRRRGGGGSLLAKSPCGSNPKCRTVGLFIPRKTKTFCGKMAFCSSCRKQ